MCDLTKPPRYMGCYLFTCSKTRKWPVCNFLYDVWISLVLSNWTKCWSGCYNHWRCHALFCMLTRFAHPYLFFLSSSLHFIHLALSTQLMRLIRAASLSATGTASVPLLSFKELWNRFVHTAFVRLEGNWLQKPNRNLFPLSFDLKSGNVALHEARTGFSCSGGPISVTLILQHFVNSFQPQNHWRFQILPSFFHNLCKMHIGGTSHKS